MPGDSRNIDRRRKTLYQGKHQLACIESSLEREGNDSRFTRSSATRRTLVAGGSCVARITLAVSILADSDGLLEARSGDTRRRIAPSC